MTNNEIIKALECCINNKCSNCPLRKMACSETVAMENALDLINRQKAKIEKLTAHIQEGIDLAKQIPEMVATAQAEAIKEFAERLKDKVDNPVLIEGKYIDRAIDIIDKLLKEMFINETKGV